MDINCNDLKVHLNIAKTSLILDQPILLPHLPSGMTCSVPLLPPLPRRHFPRSMWLVCSGNFYGCFSNRIDRLTVESPSLGLVYCYWFIDGLCLRLIDGTMWSVRAWWHIRVCAYVCVKVLGRPEMLMSWAASGLTK